MKEAIEGQKIKQRTSKSSLTGFSSYALEQSAKRREKNIQAFEETIKKEQTFIEQYKYILAQIDPGHADVKKVLSTIEKKLDNIKLSKKAIKDEKMLIKKELKMAKADS